MRTEMSEPVSRKIPLTRVKSGQERRSEVEGLRRKAKTGIVTVGGVEYETTIIVCPTPLDATRLEPQGRGIPRKKAVN